MADAPVKPLVMLPHIPHLNVRVRHPLVGWQVVYATSNHEKAQRRFDHYKEFLRGKCDMVIVKITGDQQWEVIHQHLATPPE